MFIVGPLLALISYWFCLQFGLAEAVAITAATSLWCLLWWVFEPIPIYATALNLFAFFQVTGVLDRAQIARSYGSPLILLILSGFVLSKAMARSGDCFPLLGAEFNTNCPEC